MFTDAYLPEISGVTTVVRSLRGELDRLGHETIVYAPRYDRPAEDERAIYRFRSGPVFSYKTARMALPYHRGAARSFYSLDIVHSHTPFSLAYVALMAAYRHRLPHVQTYHTFLSEYRHYVPRPIRPPVKAAEAYSAMLCNRCTTITVPTQPIAEELRRYGVRRPIHVVPFGPDVSLYNREALWNPRKEIHIDPDAPLFLYAGRLAAEKNLLFVMRAFSQIRAQDARAVFVLAGDGPLRRSLEEQAEAMGIDQAVRFPGFLDSGCLVDLYKEAGLFLFGSKTETQGLVLVEAMAGGTPAIAIGALGVRDVVIDEVNGFLSREDEREFASRALYALSDPVKYEALCQGAREAATRMSVQAQTQRLLCIFEECLARPKHRRRFPRPRFRVRGGRP